ncbi:MAG: hypothetical protein IJR17_06305 [Clostridia bacterium]|nr:hypothetical protein [Clostridia bacterium]
MGDTVLMGIIWIKGVIKRGNLKKFVAVLLVVHCLAGCTMSFPRHKPYLEDRSNGWNASVLFRDWYCLIRIADDPFFQSFVFSGSDISESLPKYVDIRDDASTIMETALKEAFHDRYIDCGTMPIQLELHETHHILLLNGGVTFAIIDTRDGRIVQCVDTRIQEQITLMSLDGYIYFTVDLATLTEDEAKQLSAFASSLSAKDMPRPFTDSKDCPLDAEKAFEVSSKNLYNLYTYGRWKHIGDGKYVIYNAEPSNSWLIVGKRFTMLLNKDTGEVMFFSVMKDGFKDLSKAV